ncbi:ABC transporter permease [Alkalihalobacillus sp. 1P02AB]|uniref:ABC transporter permease n=1 Tax=Alkalihalobacillus sp. 1P02AB TaxID=3132260 RepID=UPI0039A5A5C5
MKAIIWGEWKQVLRNPLSLIGTIVLTVIFAIVMGQGGNTTEKTVPIFSNSLSKEQLIVEVNKLNEAEALRFEIRSETNIRSGLTNQAYDLAIHLEEKDYQLFLSRQSEYKRLVEAEMTAYFNQKRLSENEIELETYSADAYTKYESFSNEDGLPFDMTLHALFGFSLFFVFYTVAFSIQSILYQKEFGLWDRVILSPTTKTEMYVGQILFSFQIGYIQLLIIYFIFKFIVGINFYGGFLVVLIAVIPYLVALVSLGILISGLVTNVRQLNGIVPFISVSMAMLGGAFFPLDIVSSDLILFLSKFSPTSYGLEMLKGATVYQWRFEQFLLPASVLFGMCAFCMGVGLNLMEKRMKYKKG